METQEASTAMYKSYEVKNHHDGFDSTNNNVIDKLNNIQDMDPPEISNPQSLCLKDVRNLIDSIFSVGSLRRVPC